MEISKQKPLNLSGYFSCYYEAPDCIKTIVYKVIVFQRQMENLDFSENSLQFVKKNS